MGKGELLLTTLAPCPHVSATGVDEAPLTDPAKIWRCWTRRQAMTKTLTVPQIAAKLGLRVDGGHALYGVYRDGTFLAYLKQPERRGANWVISLHRKGAASALEAIARATPAQETPPCPK